MWTEVGNDIYLATYNGSEIASITENDLELTKAPDLSSIIAGQFHEDRENKLLYLAPTDGLSPDVNLKTYMVYTWQGFCDSQDPENPLLFPIQGLSKSYFIPALNQASVPPLTMAVSDFFTGKMRYNFGQVKITDAGWAYKNRDRHVWKNGKIVVKIGEQGFTHEQYTTMFTGIMDTPGVDDNGMTIPVADPRWNIFSSIPVKSFLKGDYDYLDENIHYSPIPILLGEKQGIKPYPVNTKNYTYLVSQTRFDFQPDPFSLEAVTAVKKDGVLLSEGTDYTVNLTEGTFTLADSPGEAEAQITCDAKGLKIDVDFTTGAFTGSYSENIACITYILLRIQAITANIINNETFAALKSACTRRCGDYITNTINFEDYLPLLQTPGLFHLDITAGGQITVIPYSRGTAPEVYLDETLYANPQIPPDESGEESVLSKIILRYDRAPGGAGTEMETGETGENLASYKYVKAEKPETYYKYKVKKAKNFKTILLDESDAFDIALKLLEMSKSPPVYFCFNTGFHGFDFYPLQKIGITRKVSSDEHGHITVFNKEPFIIMEIQKKPGTGQCRVKARKDLAQVTGYVLTTYDGRPLTTYDGKCLTT